MKKLVMVVLLAGFMLGGCTASPTRQLVENQNAEVVALQETKRAILARPTKNAQELVQKQAELKIVNDEIKAAQLAQANAQKIQDQKTNNMVKNVVTGVGAAAGTALTVNKLLK